MTTKETGGHAFPSPDSWNRNGDLQPGDAGMELRDYFAAKAMQALITGYLHQSLLIDTLDDCAKAYEFADAMIEARK
jgi:hypothetical protein